MLILSVAGYALRFCLAASLLAHQFPISPSVPSLLTANSPASPQPSALPAPSPPAYAKWGMMAVKEAQIRYHADVLDYLHIGRVRISQTVDEERFKLWLRSQGREFGVYVYIRLDRVSEQFISIRFEPAS